MRVLDLFCGAGGAAVGIKRALPSAEIVGVDIRPQPRYPFTFTQADALTYALDGFDFIWASPPCQRYIRSGQVNKAVTSDLIDPVRQRLHASDATWVIENVPGAPLQAGLLLCGSMFGLRIRRHRLFESNRPLPLAPATCQHHLPITGVYGNAHGKSGAWDKGNKPMLPGTSEVWRREMQVDWMTNAELADAIPPAYSEYIARQVVA